MARIPGYAITVKMFITAPKSDFAAQARAAMLVDEITRDKVLTPQLCDRATVLDVSGKFTSMDASEPLPVAETAGDEPGGQTQADDETQADMKIEAAEVSAENQQEARQSGKRYRG